MKLSVSRIMAAVMIGLLLLAPSPALARGGHGGGGGGHGGGGGGHGGGGHFGGGGHGGGSFSHGGGGSFSHGGGSPSFSRGSSFSGGSSRSFGGGSSQNFGGGLSRSFSSSRGSTPSMRSFSKSGSGPSGSHSNFVQRNFNSSRGSSGAMSSKHANFADMNSGASSRNFSRGTGSWRSGQANFVSRNFKDTGSLARFSHGGNWNSKASSGGPGNFNHGSFNRGNFTRDGSHHGNWNGNNNWWGGNKGWYGYGHHGGGRGGSFFGFYPWFGWGFGYPFFGWGFGWPYYYGYYGLGYGLGYGGWGGYCYGYPYSGYGYSAYPSSNAYVYADNYAAATDQPPALDAAQAPTPSADQVAGASEFVGRGEEAFKAGRYEEAVRDWQHSLVDDPNNGAVILLMAQALFALGQYDAAANSVQMAMQMLPESEWDGVVKNYNDLYANIQAYTDQIRAAEKARDADAKDGAIRFLLGYHFGYLNYPKQAVRELDKALDIEPRDAGAQKLRDIFAKQAGLPARPPAAAPEAAPKAEGDKTPSEPTPVEPVPPAIPPANPKAADDLGVPAGA